MAWVPFDFTPWWSYGALRALEYFRSTGALADARVAEAVEMVASKRQPDGLWLLDTEHPGTMLVSLGETVGQPSRWNTLRALRVLRWAGRE